VRRRPAPETSTPNLAPARRKAIFDEYILPPCESTPQHVAFSAIRNAFDHDPEPAAKV
jgi:hypothetical protein